MSSRRLYLSMQYPAQKINAGHASSPRLPAWKLTGPGRIGGASSILNLHSVLHGFFYIQGLLKCQGKSKGTKMRIYAALAKRDAAEQSASLEPISLREGWEDSCEKHN